MIGPGPRYSNPLFSHDKGGGCKVSSYHNCIPVSIMCYDRPLMLVIVR